MSGSSGESAIKVEQGGVSPLTSARGAPLTPLGIKVVAIEVGLVLSSGPVPDDVQLLGEAALDSCYGTERLHDRLDDRMLIVSEPRSLTCPSVARSSFPLAANQSRLKPGPGKGNE